MLVHPLLRSFFLFVARLAIRGSLWLFGLMVILALLAELIDRWADSEPSYALYQIQAELSMEPDPLIQEALELRERITQKLDILPLHALRFGMANQLAQTGLSARFNPTNWRVTLSSALIQKTKEERTFIIAHEIAHAIASAQNFSPRLPAPYSGLDGSLFIFQNFHESFADLFAVLWLLHDNPHSKLAQKEMLKASHGTSVQSSAAHDTTAALHYLMKHQKMLLTQSIDQNFQWISDAATLGALLTMHHLKMEREAYCSTGLRALAKFERDLGYQLPTLPWENAQASQASIPPLITGGIEAYISSIEKLRPQKSTRHLWREWIEPEQAIVQTALLQHELFEQISLKDLTSHFKQEPRQTLQSYEQSLWAIHEAVYVHAQSRSTLRETIFWLLIKLDAALYPVKAQSCMTVS